jgi:hypothetical protein
LIFLSSFCNKQIQKKVKISLNCKCFCVKLYGFPSSLIQIYNNYKLSFGDVSLILVMESKVSWYVWGSCYSIFSFMFAFYIVICHFVLFLLVIVLSVLLWFTDFDYCLVFTDSSYKIDKKICLWTYLSQWREIINKLLWWGFCSSFFSCSFFFSLFIWFPWLFPNED